jgi:hypothetical protein
MAEILTYDPSSDPMAVASAEQRDADSLAVGEALEEAHSDLLAGKYRNAEELESAYIELQKKLGGDESNDSDDGEEAEVDEGSEEESVDYSEVQEIIDLASTEYDETGSVSPEMLEALTQMSSEDLVSAYIQMQNNAPEADTREMNDSEVSSIYNAVGGEAEYQNVMQWAETALEASDVEAYNDLVNTGNTAAISLALRGLYSQYTDNMGYEGETLQGRSAQPRDVFRSTSEVVRAMSDPRYENDPAYRADIMDKLAVSDVDF